MAAVTVLATPGRDVAEVEGDDSNEVTLNVHDVFPPRCRAACRRCSAAWAEAIHRSRLGAEYGERSGWIYSLPAERVIRFRCGFRRSAEGSGVAGQRCSSGEDLLLHRLGGRCAGKSERSIGCGRGVVPLEVR